MLDIITDLSPNNTESKCLSPLYVFTIHWLQWVWSQSQEHWAQGRYKYQIASYDHTLHMVSCHTTPTENASA